MSVYASTLLPTVSVAVATSHGSAGALRPSTETSAGAVKAGRPAPGLPVGCGEKSATGPSKGCLLVGSAHTR